MAINKTGAIVLRTRELRETSIIATFYTGSFGKISGVLKGVRGARAQYAGGALELFALDEIVFYERKGSDLFLISQCDLVNFFAVVRKDLARLAHAAYLVELLDSLVPLGDRNQAIFDLLLNSLGLLCGSSSPRRVARIFEIRLLALLGLMPAIGSCAGCGKGVFEPSRFSFRSGGLLCEGCAASDRASVPILKGTVEFMKHIVSSDFDRVSRIKVSEKVGKEVEAVLRRFLDYHIERRLNTLEFLASISS